nr:regulatory sensor-transducer BlaR1/MecR1 family [uncultured bacterium]
MMPALASMQIALLHTLWHGPLLAAALAIALFFLPAGRANLRYAAALAALCVFISVFIVTWDHEQAKHARAEVQRVLQNVSSPRIEIESDSPVAAAAAASAVTATAAASRDDLVYRMLASPWLFRFWSVGVMLMLWRVILALRGAQRLKQTAGDTADPVLVALFDDVRNHIGATRRVVLRISENVLAPVALGLIWPMVILPASLASGLPPQQMRALLAHELAHIRRYDYLVNFLQLIVETVFYFNPALWWISRQIRIEREACCDAIAARYTGSLEAYTQALADIARRRFDLPCGKLALSMAHDHRRGALFDRVRRLVSPGERPALRLRWTGLVGGSIIALVVLATLCVTTRAAEHGVKAAVTYLRLDEAARMALAGKLTEEARPMDLDHDRVRVSGRILGAGGRQLSDLDGWYGWLDVTVTDRGSSSSKSVKVEHGTFSARIPDGDTYIQATPKGYAPVSVGPLRAGPDNIISDVSVNLGPSSPIYLEVKNPEGDPLGGVEISLSYRFLESTWSGAGTVTTDTDGRVQIDQSDPTVLMALNFKAQGYQPMSQLAVKSTPGEIVSFVMQHDLPFTVTVTDDATGDPVDDAEFLMLRHGSSDSGRERIPSVRFLPGQYHLTGLQRDLDLVIGVRSRRIGAVVLDVGMSDPAEASVRLKRAYIHGRVKGDLGRLNQEDGHPVVRAWGSLTRGHMQTSYEYEPAIVEEVDGEATFAFDGLVPGEVGISAGNVSYQVTVLGPIDDFVVELNSETVMRQATIELETPRNATPANGTITITASRRQSHVNWPEQKVEIINGYGKTSVPALSSLSIRLRDLPGYVVDSDGFDGADKEGMRYLHVDTGEGAFRIHAKLEPVGAVTGTIAGPDSVPMENIQVDLKGIGENSSEEYLGGDYDGYIRSNKDGQFQISKVPMNRSVKVVAIRGMSRQEQELRLSTAKPAAEVKLEFPLLRDVSIRALTPDGKTFRNYTINIDTERGSHSWQDSTSDVKTVTGLAMESSYRAMIAPEAIYAPVECTIGPRDTEATLTLKPGKVGEGRVLIEGTNTGVPDVKVKAQPNDFAYTVWTATDQDGRFKFTNLDGKPVKVNIEDTNNNGLTVVSYEGMPLKDDGSTVLRVQKSSN